MMLFVHPTLARATRRIFALLGVALAMLLLLWWLPSPPGASGVAHYLPLHITLETASIMIAVMVFVSAWLSPSNALPTNLKVLSCCFIGVAALDFSHMLAYQGMPDFITPSDPEKAINFWLVARLLSALGLMGAVASRPERQGYFDATWLLIGVGAYVVAAHAVFLLRPDWTPETYISGSGLTPFKISFEYALVLIFMSTFGLLLWQMRLPCPFDAPALLGAAGLMAMSEFFFTMYGSVTDVYNLAGHFYKIGAYVLVFQCMVVDNVRRPYRALASANEALSVSSGQLADEHRRLENILAGTRAGTWEWNVTTGACVFNERWATIAGYALEELQPVSIETWQSLAHPDDLAVSEAALRRYFDGEAPHYECVVRIRHKAGHWIWVRDSGAVQSWAEDGAPEWMFGTHIDVTESRQAELLREEALRRVQQLSNSVPGVLFECRLTGGGTHCLTYLSERVEAVFGVRAEELMSRSDTFDILKDYVGATELAAYRAEVERALMHLQPWNVSFSMHHPVFGKRYLRSETRCGKQFDGAPVWFGYLHDETEAHEIQERLRLSARVFEATQGAMLVTDAKHSIIDLNPAFEALSGYPKAELLGKNPRMFSSGRQNADFYQQMHDSLLRDQCWQGEIWNRHKSGAFYVCMTSITAVTNEAGELEHYVAAYADVGLLMAQQDHLRSLAHFDALTQLPNRRLLDDRLQQAIAAAQRNGTQLAVCLLDLDGFKHVNDTFGHAEGDELLVQLARRMQSIIRAEETLARLGGDEFVLVLLDGNVGVALERLLEVVREPVRLRCSEFAQVSASIGVSCYRPGVEGGGQLLQEADEALYKVKRSGKNRWLLSDRSIPSEIATCNQLRVA